MEELNAHPGVYTAAVINLLWSELEPQQGVFDDSALTSGLAAIAAYDAAYPSTPVTAKLRIFAGAGTPAWVIQLTGGPITVTDNSGTIEIGAFWTAAYRTAWQGLQAHLASEYDGSPLIAEVAISSCSSLTAEPFIAPLSAASLVNMRQFGFSDAAYMACLSGAVDDYAPWIATPLDFTFNAYRNSDGCTTGSSGACLVGNPAFSIQVMDAFRAALGPAHAVVANHGLQDPLASGAQPIYSELQNLYAEAQALTPPSTSALEFQTYAPTVDWDSTIALGLTYHPTEIEVWDTQAAGGSADISLAQLQNYASQLAVQPVAYTGAQLVSAATLHSGAVAPASLVSIFGPLLAPASGSTTVTVTDASGAPHTASLLYVSSTQINALLAPNLAVGPAVFSVAPSGGPPVSGTLLISAAAPGIFAANASGSGIAAAQTVTTHADGSSATSNVFSCIADSCSAIPIDLNGPGERVYLVLYGTGLGDQSPTGTSVLVGSLLLTPSYAGPQPQFPGLDQVNVLLPASLAGAGFVNVAVSSGQSISNTLTIAIQ